MLLRSVCPSPLMAALGLWLLGLTAEVLFLTCWDLKKPPSWRKVLSMIFLCFGNTKAQMFCRYLSAFLVSCQDSLLFFLSWNELYVPLQTGVTSLGWGSFSRGSFSSPAMKRRLNNCCPQPGLQKLSESSH